MLCSHLFILFYYLTHLTHFTFRYETSNGISAEETGQVVNEGQKDEYTVVVGQFKYTGLDGVTYLVTYTADKDGFRPEGAHLPKSP